MLFEASARTPERRVDPDRGIVFGVKVIGPDSSNQRRYTEDCLKKAVRLYEGCAVNADHPDDPEDQRSIRDRLGVLHNARYLPGKGIYADLHLIRSHPLAESVLEAAQNPKLSRVWGCSHNADGDVEMRDGVLTVLEIQELRSVDLVCDPATTTGLFESVDRKRLPRQSVNRGRTPGHRTRGKKMKLREWFDRTKLLRPVRRKLKALMEQGYMDPDSEVMEEDVMPEDVESSPGATPSSDPADMEPEEALKQGFRAAMVAVLDDTTMPVKDKISKLKRLLTVADELTASGQEIPEEEDEDEELEDSLMEDDDLEDEELLEDDEEEEEILEADDAGNVIRPNVDNSATKSAPSCAKGGNVKASMKESKRSLIRKIRYLAAERSARDLCESEGVKASGALLEALAKLPSQAKQLALLEQLRTPRKAKTAPDFDPKRATAPHVNGDDVSDNDDFVRAITGRGK